MGNVKTTHIKQLSVKLIEVYPTKFTTDFSKNKTTLGEMMDFDSKLTRNKVAGYITHDLGKIRSLKTLKVSYQNPNLDKRKRRRN